VLARMMFSQPSTFSLMAVTGIPRKQSVSTLLAMLSGLMRSLSPQPVQGCRKAIDGDPAQGHRITHSVPVEGMVAAPASCGDRRHTFLAASACRRILPSRAGRVNVRNWPSAPTQRPVAEVCLVSFCGPRGSCAWLTVCECSVIRQVDPQASAVMPRRRPARRCHACRPA